MEFKSIDQLSLRDCCKALKIELKDLRRIVELPDKSPLKIFGFITADKKLNEYESQIAIRLSKLLFCDVNAYLQCVCLTQKGTLAAKEAYERYISSYPDGLWVNELKAKLALVKEEQTEKDYYAKNKGTVEGLNKYILKYPRGHFVQDAKKSIAAKKRKAITKRGLIFLMSFSIVFVICYVNYQTASYISTESHIEFGKKGGSEQVSFSTDAPSNNIQVVEDEGWVDCKIKDGFLEIKAGPNHGNSRTTTIHLYAYTTLFGLNLWRQECNIQVEEQSGLATYLMVDNHDYVFDKYGNGEFITSIKTDGMNLKIVPSDKWINIKQHVDETGNNFVARLTISVSTNDTGAKTGKVLVSSDGYREEILIKQQSGLATYFDVSPYSLVMAEDGTEEGYHYPIKVDTDGTTWTISNAPDWLNAEANISQGKIMVTLPQNTGQIKTGTITVLSNNGDSRVIDVKQWGDPTNFSASSSTVRFGTSSDYEYISISNNSRKKLSVADDDNWLSATVTNNSKIKISCSQNYSSPRSGSVTVTCGNEEFSIIIKQDGWANCSNCNGNGQVGCNNYQASWRYYPAYNANYHQVYQVTGQYYSYGAWFPQYSWVNCPTCGGDGKIECTRCDGRGKIRKSY